MQVNNQGAMYYNENLQEAYDTRSVVSEPVQLMPVIEQNQPVTIRKYKTTKTTTTTHHVMPQPQLKTHMYTANRLNCSQNNNQAFDQYTNQTNSQAYHREANAYNLNEQVPNIMRSSSIPRSFQQAHFNDQNLNRSSTQLDQSASSMRYMSSRNAMANNESSLNRARIEEHHGEQKRAGLASSSCIDYSNSFYNSDWHMRHGNHLKRENSIPTELPIYMQRN